MAGTPTFAETWPSAAERLRRTLMVRGVPAQDRDDVVQETGLRIYRAWADVDHDRPLWPFVVTVALNVWRDLLRERAGHPAQAWDAAASDFRDHQDVERAVLARQELASVGAAIRTLAPEQRRLLLATDELEDVVRPLLPAERVARMRVRKQLARAVGRASAVVALVWLRRPVRSAGLVATAYITGLAAAVFTVPTAPSSPGRVVPSPYAVNPVHLLPGDAQPVALMRTRVAAAPITRGIEAASAPSTLTHSLGAPDPFAKKRTVCSPVRPPANGLSTQNVTIPAQQAQQPGGNGRSQAITSTPQVQAQGQNGCVSVG